MSPIFHGRDQRPPTVKVLKICKGPGQFIQFLGDQSANVECRLHWLDTHKKTVPCLHEECVWCPQPTQYAAYAPIVAYDQLKKVWKPTIFYITGGIANILEDDHRGEIIEVRRLGDYRNAPLTWKVREDLKPHQQPPLEPFDVEPALLKMWGMYALLKKQEKEQIPDAATIKFPGVGGGAGKAVS